MSDKDKPDTSQLQTARMVDNRTEGVSSNSAQQTTTVASTDPKPKDQSK